MRPSSLLSVPFFVGAALLQTALAVSSLVVRAAEEYPSAPARSFGVLLYPGFAPLDVFGPLEYVNALSTFHNITLHLISETGGPISSVAQAPHTMVSNNGMSHTMTPKTIPVSETVLSTQTFATAPKLDILLIPGGMGARMAINNTNLTSFIRDRFNNELEYLITVCTGSALAARSGVLDNKKATGTKFSWKWITQQGPNVNWLPQARWVEDGKIISSSGVTSALDMMHYFITKLYGDKLATRLSNVFEFTPQTDPSIDPFAAVWNVTAATPVSNQSSTDVTAQSTSPSAASSLFSSYSMSTLMAAVVASFVSAL
ncbi:class I glutamine amidotransferase-like protein [Powellomyces hirtus]|nr:class I glutamine amidotransferase-like protein [Powellomyces hirtus]